MILAFAWFSFWIIFGSFCLHWWQDILDKDLFWSSFSGSSYSLTYFLYFLADLIGDYSCRLIVVLMGWVEFFVDWCWICKDVCVRCSMKESSNRWFLFFNDPFSSINLQVLSFSSSIIFYFYHSKSCRRFAIYAFPYYFSYLSRSINC